MSTDTVPVQEVVEEIVEQPVDQVEQQEAEEPAQEQAKEQMVPLSAVQKERRKRQEIEQELKWHKDQMMQKTSPAPEPDESLYEAATKEDLGKSQQQIMRAVEERSWVKNNPEKVQEVNEKLAEFLKQRPNLTSAIESATNRYEEAWELMSALSPKQKAALRSAPIKKDAPGNPAAVPKAAALNQTVDVMQMSDSEFNSWRKSQRKSR